jgi:hypothetical protein
MGLRNYNQDTISAGKNLKPDNSAKLQEREFQCCSLQLCVYRKLTFGKITYEEVCILGYLYNLVERLFLHQYFCRNPHNNSKSVKQTFTTFNLGTFMKICRIAWVILCKYDDTKDYFTCMRTWFSRRIWTKSL